MSDQPMLEDELLQYATAAERTKFFHDSAQEKKRRRTFFSSVSNLETILTKRQTEQMPAQVVREVVDHVDKEVQKMACAGKLKGSVVIQDDAGVICDWFWRELGECWLSDEGEYSAWTTAMQKSIEKALLCKGYPVAVVDIDNDEVRVLDLDWSSPAKESEVDNSRTGLKGKCPVCWEEDVSLKILLPCGHTNCAGCAQKFVGKACPVCRQHVTNSNDIFTC